MLKVESVSYQVQNRSLLKGVTFSLRQGELLAVVGANGAGKSTLISVINGENRPSDGKILLNNKPLNEYKSEELALKRATLSQHNTITMAFSVEEIVMMGRYPHFKGEPKQADYLAVEEAMKISGVEDMAERSYLTMSGGEQQRVQLARVLAQLWDCPGGLLLLDEPVSGLDLLYQQQTLAIAKAFAKQGFMVIAVLHDLNLAAQYADRILMMKDGRRWKDGTPAQVLNTQDIYSVFGIETEVVMNRKTLTPYLLPKEVKLTATHFNSSFQSDSQAMSLKEQYADYRALNPDKGIRDAIEAIGVSEVELLMTRLGDNVIRLRPEMNAILESLQELGTVMGSTQNNDGSIDVQGKYGKFSLAPNAGLFLGAMDLRITLQYWETAFAVDDNGRQSLQFFDRAGKLLHKVALMESSSVTAFTKLVRKFKSDNHIPAQLVRENSEAIQELPDREIDIESFRSSWEKLTDTHEFSGLLRNYGVTRTQALRLAPENRAEEIAFDLFQDTMVHCLQQKIPLMIFVGNQGCMHICTGEAKNLINTGNSYQIMNPEFNLNLTTKSIASIWKVVKPSADGDIHSVELFDVQGDLIVQFFGKRKPGIPELSAWRELHLSMSRSTSM